MNIRHSINQSLFACLSLLTIPISYFEANADSTSSAITINQVPAPCQAALSANSDLNIKTTSPLFGACQCSDEGAMCHKRPAVMAIISDQIISFIVESRINNIYLGIDGILTPNASSGLSSIPTNHPIWMMDPNFLKGPAGVGKCSETGACNPFCGEGGTPLFDNSSSTNHFPSITFDIASVGLTAPSSMPSPTLGLHGYKPNSSELLFTGLTKDVIEPSNLKVRSEHFYSQGVFRNPDGTPFSGSSPTQGIVDPRPTPTSPVFSYGPGAKGWPAHAALNTSTLGKVCRAAPPTDQPHFGNHTVHCFGNVNHYHVRSITWSDGTFPATNQASDSVNCDHAAVIEFSESSTINALHNGAMVQATWKALDDVVNEISAPPYVLNITQPECQALAPQYITDLKTAADALMSIEDKSAKELNKIMAEECYTDGSKPQDALNPPNQLYCYTQALLSSIETANFPTIAACEVTQRAQALFENAFKSDQGKAWVQQLKNWSFSACAQAEQDDLYNKEAPAGTCVGLATAAGAGACTGTCGGICGSAAVGCGILTLGTAAAGCLAGCMALCLPSCTATAAIIATKVVDTDQTDRCIQKAGSCEDPILNDLKTAYSGAKMANCVPYAYSAALSAYMGVMGFKPTPHPSASPIQLSYKSSRLDKKTKQPLVEVTNCQITDRSPAPRSDQAPGVPYPRPTISPSL